MAAASIVVIGLVLSKLADGMRDPVTSIRSTLSSALAAAGACAKAGPYMLAASAPATAAGKIFTLNFIA
jgi:hypothetical protein